MTCVLDGGLVRYSRLDMTDDSAVVVSGHLAMSGNFVPAAGFGTADVVVRDNLEREALNEENITALGLSTSQVSRSDPKAQIANC